MTLIPAAHRKTKSIYDTIRKLETQGIFDKSEINHVWKLDNGIIKFKKRHVFNDLKLYDDWVSFKIILEYRRMKVYENEIGHELVAE